MRDIKRSFAGGEVAETIQSRDDLAKYSSSCKIMENFIAQVHGGARYRTGTKFLGNLGSKRARLIPFEFNTSIYNQYVLVFLDFKIKFVQGDGFVLDSEDWHYEIISPYSYADLREIDYVQQGDVVYLAHPAYPLKKLVRKGHTDWELTNVTFIPSVIAPSGGAATWHGQSILGNLSAPSSVSGSWVGGGEPDTPRYYKISAESTTRGESLPSSSVSVTDKDDINGYVSLSWSSVTNATRYNVYVSNLFDGTFNLLQTVTRNLCRIAQPEINSGDSTRHPLSSSDAQSFKQAYKITAVNKDGQESYATESIEVVAYPSSEWIAGDYIELAFNNDSEGAEEYNIYKESGGYWGFVGIVETNAAATLTFRDDNFSADTTYTPPKPGGTEASAQEQSITLGYARISAYVGYITATGAVFSASSLGEIISIKTPTHPLVPGKYIMSTLKITAYHSPTVVTAEITSGGYDHQSWSSSFWGISEVAQFLFPSAVSIFQQRLILGGSSSQPSTIKMSRTGDYENFSVSSPLRDDDALEFTLASSRIDQIRWIIPFGDLLVGTSGAEFEISGDPLTPVNAKSTVQSYWGSGGLPPLIIGDSIIQVQRQGSKVRDLFYSLEKDGYSGNNLSVLANHLFAGHQIIAWAYQAEPDSVIWCVRDDGVLLGMTYLKEHEIWGWHRHTTDGNFTDVCVISGDKEDTVYFVVNRGTGHFLEKLMPVLPSMPWHLDCALIGNVVAEREIVMTLEYLSGPGGVGGGAVLLSSADYFTTQSVGAQIILREYIYNDFIDYTVTVTAYINAQQVSVTVLPAKTFLETNTWGIPVNVIAGLEHLANRNVSVVADGKVFTDVPVSSSGNLTLNEPATDILIGLPYTGVIAPLPFETQTQSGTTQGLTRQIGEIHLRLYQSAGGQFAVSGINDKGIIKYNDIEYEAEAWGEPTPLFTGTKKVVPTSNPGQDLTIYVRQELPLPFNLLSIIGKVDFGQA